MKSLLLICFLAFVSQAHAAYTFVAAHKANGVATLSLTVTAGQNLVILAADEETNNSTLTIADGTNTYVVRGTVNDGFHNATRTLIDCLSPTPGTYTLTLSGATNPNMEVLVYTGLAAFSAGSFQSVFAQNPALTTDSAATAAITPTSYPAAIIAMGAFTSITTFTAGTGFTGRAVTTWQFGNGVLAEDLELASGSHIASYTPGAANANLALVAGAYLESASPPPRKSNMSMMGVSKLIRHKPAANDSEYTRKEAA